MSEQVNLELEDHRMPLALFGGVFCRELSTEELRGVSGGTVTLHCDKDFTDCTQGTD